MTNIKYKTTIHVKKVLLKNKNKSQLKLIIEFIQKVI